LANVRQLSNTQLQLTRQRRRAQESPNDAAQLNCISLDSLPAAYGRAMGAGFLMVSAGIARLLLRKRSVRPGEAARRVVSAQASG
jgi:hypothetical protein